MVVHHGVMCPSCHIIAMECHQHRTGRKYHGALVTIVEDKNFNLVLYQLLCVDFRILINTGK